MMRSLLRLVGALATAGCLQLLASSTLAQCPPVQPPLNFDSIRAPLLPPGVVASQGVNVTGAPLWVSSNVIPHTAPNDLFSTAPDNILDNRLDFAVYASPFDHGISFLNNYNLESGRDGAVLEISVPGINAGAFTDITDPAVGGFVSPGYNSAISTAFQSPIGGRMAWSGNSGGYALTFIELGNAAFLPPLPATVILRFRLVSDNNTSSTGWRIDSFSFFHSECPTPSPSPTSSPTPTATATPIATPCGSPNVIADPTFEAGTPWPSWTVQTSTNFGTPLCNTATCGTGDGTAPPYAGDNWAWFGGANVAETATLGQNVLIPAGGQAQLNFVMRIGRVSMPFTDVLNVKVDGTIVQSYPEPDQPEFGYSLRAVDLSAFADGAFHLISFEYVGTTSGISSYAIDNVALTTGPACASPTPGPATHFAVVAPAGVVQYFPFNFNVTAQDQFNNTATGYTGTVHFTSTSTGNGTHLPADSTLTNGTGAFMAMLGSPGSQTITATDTINSSITGTSNPIMVFAKGSPTPTATATATATATGTPFVTPCPNAGVFGEGFDGVIAPALPAGWSAFNAAGPAPLWVTSTTMPNSPPNAAFVDDPAVVSDKRLDSPEIGISGNQARVSFSNFYDLETSSTPGAGFDGAVLEVSINGGPFTDITDPAIGGSFITGGYNAMISTAFMSPLAGRMAWSGNSEGYIATFANLGPNVVGHFIKLRFRMASDNNGSGTGWRVDNIGVSVICQSPTPTPTPSCPPLTHSSTQTIAPANSVSCNNEVGHTDNSYWRAFNMASFVGEAQFNVSSVSFGVESANNSQPVTVRLYTNSGGAFPGGTRTQIATTTITVTSAETGTVVTTPLMATVPAGTSELVMELFTPNGEANGNLFFVGSNVDPQTGPSYLSAADCGVTVPTDVATLGFPNMHVVFKVDGSCTTGTPSPTPTPTATATGTVSPTPTPTPTPTPSPAQALNLSTRMLVQTGDNVGIGGFIITGSMPKQVVVRAIGPSLGPVGVPNPLADPVLELHGPAGFTTIVNENWRDTQEPQIIATGLAPTNDLESAILVTVDPGAYTAVVRGTSNTEGVGLVEVYDLGPATSQLANISTRGYVGTGNEVMIGGFIVGNGGNTHIVIRGLGPSLSPFGIGPVLLDPTLELRDGNGVLLASNDNCAGSTLPPPDPLEACIEITLPAGLYTAILAGKDGGTGVGLVEIYNLN